VTALSPCIAVCVMDTRTGWCKGCYRTIGEIAGWLNMNDAERHAVLAALPARRLEAPKKDG
jgi:predicted Fe-S protein YdhL (DUF1289 family)